MTILDACDYITGKRHLGNAPSNIYRADESTLMKADEIFKSVSPTAIANLKRLESAKAFYNAEPDVKQSIPARERDEFFYAYKLGMASPIIPAKAVFLMKECFDKYGTLNYMSKVLPKTDFNLMISKGYIDGEYSLFDAACSLVDSSYQPLSIAQLKVKHGDFYDVYIQDVDAVVLLPESIASLLCDTDIENIKFENGYLRLGNKPLRFLSSDYYGSVDNVYDYRRII